MRKYKRFKNLICTVLAAALTAAMPAGIAAEDTISGASVTFGNTITEDRAQAVISSTPTDDNYALAGEKEGRECIITQVKRSSTENKNDGIAEIPIIVDDDYISQNDRNIAVKLTYFDHDWDTIHITYKTANGGTYKHDIIKYATNTWRVATIVLRKPSLNGTLAHNADLLIGAAEDTLIRETEYISKIEIINLDKSYIEANSLSKTDILHITEARVLSDMGLFGGFALNDEKYGLDKALTLEEAAKAVIRLCYGGREELQNAVCSASDVSEGAKPYIGLAIEKGLINLNSDGTIGATRIVTINELLEMFVFAVTGIRGNGSLAAAKSLGLVKTLTSNDEYGITGSGVFNVVPGMWSIETNDLSRYAYLDDLAAISYAMMDMTLQGSEKKVMASLFERGVFERSAIVNSGAGELLYNFYRQTGFDIVEKSYVDKDTGVTVNTLSLPGLPSTGGYAHSMNMSADGKKIVIGAGIDTSSNYCTLVVYDRETKKTTPLNPDLKESYYYGYMVAPNVNKVYYNCAREVYEFDLTTMTNRYVTAQGTNERLWCGVPSVSDDGEILVQFKYDKDYANYGKESARPLYFDIVNTKSGTITTPFTGEQVMALRSPRGDYTVKSIGHVTVNPKYKNLFSYVLQYEEDSSPFELWVYNSDTNTHTCIYSDHVDENGKKDVNTSHWVWSDDGEKSCFIKYYGSDYITELPGVGMVWVDKDGNEDYDIEGYINGDYSYNHMGVSPNDRYFVGDNTSRWNGERFESKVILVDGETGESRILANKIGIWVNHPGHVHPLISEDCSTVSFTMAGDNHHLMAAYIDLDTLPEINEKKYEVAYASLGSFGVEKGIELYREYDDRAWYSDIAVQTAVKKGKNCLEISPKHRAPFEVLAQYVKPEENTVTFRIEYFDNGSTPIELLYNSTYLEGTAQDRNRRVYSFNRENTNKWQSKEITLSDVCFSNSAPGASDFSINAPSSSDPVYIKKICVAAGDSIEEGSIAEDNKFVRSEYSYFKNGEAFDPNTAVAAGEVITARVLVGNTKAAAQEATLITALYASDDSIAAVYYTSQTLAFGKSAELEAVVTAPSDDLNAQYSIKSYLWNGLGSMIPCTDIVTALSAPTGLTVNAVTTSTAALSWMPVSDANDANVLGYKIYRNGIEVGITSDLSYIDTGLNDNISYTYTVKAFGAGCLGYTSDAVSATTENIASLKMSDLTVDSSAATPVGAHTGADGLDVYKCYTEGTTFVTNFDPTNYTVENNAGTYSVGEYFGETCYASYGMKKSMYGMMFQIPINSPLRNNEPMETTFIFRYYDNGTNPIRLTYRSYYEGTTPKNDTITVTREGSNTWKTCAVTVDRATFKSGNYQFWFAPNDNNGAIYISEVGVARNYVSNLIDTPDNLTVTGTTTSTVTLSWDASETEGINGYNIYRDGTKVGSTANLTYTDVNLDDDTTYSYRITAYKDSVESDPSAPVSAATTIIAEVNMSDLSSYSTASEGPTTNYDSYKVRVRTVGGTWISGFNEATAEDNSCGIVKYGTEESGKEWCYASKNMSKTSYGMLIDIASNSIFRTQENDVTLIVRYFDNGNAIRIRHRGSVSTGTDVTLVKPHTGTNTWKTAEYNIGNAKFLDHKAVQFTTGSDDGTIYISKVSLAINYVPKTTD